MPFGEYGTMDVERRIRAAFLFLRLVSVFHHSLLSSLSFLFSFR